MKKLYFKWNDCADSTGSALTAGILIKRQYDHNDSHRAYSPAKYHSSPKIILNSSGPNINISPNGNIPNKDKIKVALISILDISRPLLKVSAMDG